MKTTVSIIKADVGSLAGHSFVPKPLIEVAEGRLSEAVETGLINSFYVFNAGDDLELLMTHFKGENSEEVHRLA
ncbi:MAG: fructose 1,6-bisphosphatase, partial [Candidatus Bathyarchaeia archaeon]